MNEVTRIEDTWCRYLPLLHRILADPSQEELFPRLQARSEHADVCAYWDTLYYFLHTILGWRALGKGLSWWYAEGKPTDEPLLKLVRKLWDYEDQLDYFAAWAWTQVCCLSPDELSPAAIAPKATWGDETWWRTFKRKGRLYATDAFYGGTNPLHLGVGHSDRFGIKSDSSGTPTWYCNTAKREAFVIVSSIEAWRTDLEIEGKQLPSLNGGSWHVNVFDRRVGFLGNYRQSRETGLWFMGKHSLHMRGN